MFFSRDHKYHGIGGAISVAIAVPLSCLKTNLSCSNILIFRTHSTNLIKESVETVLFLVVSIAFLFVCVFIFFQHERFFRLQDVPDIWVLLPSSFVSLSENIFYLQGRKLQPALNWRESDMIQCSTQR